MYHVYRNVRFLIGIFFLLSACTATDNWVPAEGAPILLGTEWTLQSLNGHPLLPGTSITIEFGEYHYGLTAVGLASCNHYELAYEQDGNRLTFPETTNRGAITEVLYLEPDGIMEQEQEYLDALKRAAKFKVVGERLIITDEGGEVVLDFTRT